MLTPEELKPYLLHEDADIRNAVADYFRQGDCRDETLVPNVLEACDRFGHEANLHGLVACRYHSITEPALLDILERLHAPIDPENRLRMNRFIARAPVELLDRHDSIIRETPGIDQKSIDLIDSRREFSGWTAERLWKRLNDFAEESRSKNHVGSIDHQYADNLIEALAPHDVPDTQTLCRMLADCDEETGWLEVFLVDLAGQRRVREAIPALVDKYRIDNGYLLERCTDALAKIGDPEAVRLIGESFPEEDWHYKNYTSRVLSRIKAPLSEETLIHLLEAEKDLSIRTVLNLGLLDLFSRRGVEIVRQEILADRFDPHYVALDEDILPVMDVLGLDFPEADRWRRNRAKIVKRRAERAHERAEMARQYARLEQMGIHAIPEGAIQTAEPSAPSTTYRHHDAKIGRNDPCPCGSGRKYKKCCLKN